MRKGYLIGLRGIASSINGSAVPSQLVETTFSVASIASGDRLALFR